MEEGVGETREQEAFSICCDTAGGEDLRYLLTDAEQQEDGVVGVVGEDLPYQLVDDEQKEASVIEQVFVPHTSGRRARFQSVDLTADPADVAIELEPHHREMELSSSYAWEGWEHVDSPSPEGAGVRRGTASSSSARIGCQEVLGGGQSESTKTGERGGGGRAAAELAPTDQLLNLQGEREERRGAAAAAVVQTSTARRSFTKWLDGLVGEEEEVIAPSATLRGLLDMLMCMGGQAQALLAHADLVDLAEQGVVSVTRLRALTNELDELVVRALRHTCDDSRPSEGGTEQHLQGADGVSENDIAGDYYQQWGTDSYYSMQDTSLLASPVPSRAESHEHQAWTGTTEDRYEQGRGGGGAQCGATGEALTNDDFSPSPCLSPAPAVVVGGGGEGEQLLWEGGGAKALFTRPLQVVPSTWGTQETWPVVTAEPPTEAEAEAPGAMATLRSPTPPLHPPPPPSPEPSHAPTLGHAHAHVALVYSPESEASAAMREEQELVLRQQLRARRADLLKMKLNLQTDIRRRREAEAAGLAAAREGRVCSPYDESKGLEGEKELKKQEEKDNNNHNDNGKDDAEGGVLRTSATLSLLWASLNDLGKVLRELRQVRDALSHKRQAGGGHAHHDEWRRAALLKAVAEAQATAGLPTVVATAAVSPTVAAARAGQGSLRRGSFAVGPKPKRPSRRTIFAVEATAEAAAAASMRAFAPRAAADELRRKALLNATRAADAANVPSTPELPTAVSPTAAVAGVGQGPLRPSPMALGPRPRQPHRSSLFAIEAAAGGVGAVVDTPAEPAVRREERAQQQRLVIQELQEVINRQESVFEEQLQPLVMQQRVLAIQEQHQQPVIMPLVLQQQQLLIEQKKQQLAIQLELDLQEKQVAIKQLQWVVQQQQLAIQQQHKQQLVIEHKLVIQVQQQQQQQQLAAPSS